MTTYHQLLSAISEPTAHLTFPFPFTFNQNTAHNCWIQTGYANPDIVKRTNIKQHYYYRVWDPINNFWFSPKCKFSADIILLYIITHPTTNINVNIPQYLSLNFNTTTQTAKDIYNFIQPTNPNNSITDPNIPLPLRIFNHFQRQLLRNHLLSLNEPLATVNSILWSEPIEGTHQHTSISIPNTNLLLLTAINKLELSVKKLISKSSDVKANTLASQFFKLYTATSFPQERQDDLGWPDPQSLKDRELRVLSPEGRDRPDTVARWAKWDAVYAYWNDAEALLQAHPDFTPQELAHIQSLISQLRQS